MTAIVSRRNVLLLNASFEPMRAITIKRAVSLMMKDVVEPVEGTAANLRTPSTTFHVPSVIRLRRYVNVPRRNATWSRRGVIDRDGCRCAYCGIGRGDRHRGRSLQRSDFTIDHVIPISRGGASSWVNTVCACYWCNHRKANKTPGEAGLALRWEPKTPRVNYLIASGDVPAAWKAYIRSL